MPLSESFDAEPDAGLRCHSSRVWNSTAAPIGLICLIAIASLWPLPLHISTHIPMPSGVDIGSRIPQDGDPLMFCWNLWWIRGWIERDHPLHQCFDLYHPFGIILTHHTLALANGFPGALLSRLFSFLTTYNLLLFFHLILTGTVCFKVCRTLSHPLWASLAGAITAMLWPARQVRDLVHPNLSGTGFLWLTILFLIQFMRRPTRSKLLLAFFASAASVFQDPHQILFLILLSPGFISCAQESFTKRLKRWAMVMIVILIPVIPAALPVITTSSQFLDRPNEEKARFSVVPESFLSVPGNLPIGRMIGNPAFPNGTSIESVGYLGISICLILLIGQVWKYPSAMLWLGLSGVSVLLALGPSVQIAGVSVPMPWRMLGELPGLDIARAPGRFMIAAGFACALAISSLLSSLSVRSRQGRIWSPAAAMLILVDFFPAPVPMKQAEIPAIYEDFNAPDANRPAVFDVPSDPSIRIYQYYQIAHQRPISSGFVSRIPPSVFHVRDGIPLLGQLSDSISAPSALIKATPAEISDLLSILDASTIVIHRKHLSRTALMPPDMLAILWQASRWRDDGERIVLDFSRPPVPKASKHAHDAHDSSDEPACNAPVPVESFARFYFLTGWHSIEEWSSDRMNVRWTSGGTADLVVFAPHDAREIHIRGDFFPAPFDRSVTQTITVTNGTRDIARFVVDRSMGWTHQEWDIPGPFPDDGLNLCIQADPVLSPDDRKSNDSGDSRQLGVALSAFGVEVR